MKTEISAGGIVARLSHGLWEVLLVQDMNGSWTFPKGTIEPGENAEHAALREVREEVGLRTLSTLKKLPAIGYTYKKNCLIKKTVHYFVFTFEGKENLINQTSEGIHNATWIPIDRAIKLIGYPKTNKGLLVSTKDFLWKLHVHRT
jgi:8-oxo-dGTP pyrophosphatase MutT (NUDIX family)